MSGPVVDEEDRKIFAGGLTQDCTQDDLKDYFTQFGELERVQLKMDPLTGRSRGFAFIVFKELESMENVVSQEHEIKGKKATIKKADIKPGKIYVGKIPSGVTDDDIRNFFSDHGVITEFVRPIDKANNNEPKNFCFITFEKERVSKKLVNMGCALVNGQNLLIKDVNPNPRDPSMRGGMGGRGGGRGGGYGAGQWGGQGGYGGGAWDQGGYGAGAWDSYGGGAAGYGGAQSNDYSGYQGGGYGAQTDAYGGGSYDTGYGSGYGGGGYGGSQMGGGKMVRGGRGGARGGGRGRGGRGAPY